MNNLEITLKKLDALAASNPSAYATPPSISFSDRFKKLGIYRPRREIRNILLASFLILICWFSSQATLSTNSVISQEHVYFINETFDNHHDLTQWTGTFSKGMSSATVSSSSARMDFDLSSWDGTHALKLTIDAASGTASFYTAQGRLIYQTGDTGSQALDLSEYFAGYRSSTTANPLSPANYGKSSLYVVLSGGAEFSSIQLYSDVTYNLLNDKQFAHDKLAAAVTMDGSSSTDTPIFINQSNTMVAIPTSTYSSNARAFKVFDVSSQTSQDVDLSTATGMAGRSIELPLVPFLTLSFAFGLSANPMLSDLTSVQMRIHFIPNGYEQATEYTALTDWYQVADPHFPIYTQTPLDISSLGGMTGKFTIEVKITNLIGMNEFRPRSDVYFVLLAFQVTENNKDIPQSIADPIMFAQDYVRLNQAKIIPVVNGTALSSSDSGSVASYLIDSSSFYKDYSFSADTYNLDFAMKNNALQDNWVHDTNAGTLSIAATPGYATHNQIVYRALGNDYGYWNHEGYAYTIGMTADSNAHILNAGIGIGQSNYGGNRVYYAASIVYDHSQSLTAPAYIKVDQYSCTLSAPYSCSSTTIADGSNDTNWQIDPTAVSYTIDSTFYFTIVDNGDSLEFYVSTTADSVFINALTTSIDGVLLSNRNEVSLVGEFGTFSSISTYIVENDLVNKIYIYASNPSDKAVSLSVTRTTPGYFDGFGNPDYPVFGNVTIPADSPDMAMYTMTLDNPHWHFVDRIRFDRDADGSELILNKFVIDGISQPGFTRDMNMYYNKASNTVTTLTSVIQNDRLATALPINVLPQNPGFEETSTSFINQTGSGTLQIKTSADRSVVYDGQSSLMVTVDNTAGLYHEVSIPIDFSTSGITSLSFNYLLNNFKTNTNSSLADYVEAYLVGTNGVGSQIALLNAFAANTLRLTAIESTPAIANGEAAVANDNFASGTMPLSTWITSNIDLSSVSALLQGNTWHLVFRLTSMTDGSAAASPTLLLDDISGYSNSNTVSFVSSIDAMLIRGANRLELRGISTGKYVPNRGWLYPTLKFMLRRIDDPGSSAFEIGNAFQLYSEESNAEAKAGISFTLDKSGYYEIMVVADDTTDQSNIQYEFMTMYNTNPQSYASAWNVDGLSQKYGGYQTDFGSNGQNVIDNSGGFSELSSYNRDFFTKRSLSIFDNLHTNNTYVDSSSQISNSQFYVPYNYSSVAYTQTDLSMWGYSDATFVPTDAPNAGRYEFSSNLGATDLSINSNYGTPYGMSFNGDAVFSSGTSDYIVLPNEAFNGLTNFTIATAFTLSNTLGTGDYSTILNGVDSSYTNMLAIYLSQNYIYVAVNGQEIRFNFAASQGTHYSLIITRSLDTLQVLEDGQKLTQVDAFTDTNPISTIASTVIGNDQDCYLGCFQDTQDFEGTLSYLYVWNYVTPDVLYTQNSHVNIYSIDSTTSTSSISYQFPNLDPYTFDLAISGIGWDKISSTDTVSGSITIFSDGVVIAKIGVTDLWSGPEAFEYLQTLAGSYQDGDHYAPLVASDRSLHIYALNDTMYIEAYLNGQTVSFNTSSGLAPTSIEIDYSTPTFTSGTGLADSSSFSMGLVTVSGFAEPDGPNIADPTSYTFDAGNGNKGSLVIDASPSGFPSYINQTSTYTHTFSGNSGVSTLQLSPMTAYSQNYYVGLWFYYQSGVAGATSIGIYDSTTSGVLGTFAYNGDTNMANWPADQWIHLISQFSVGSATGFVIQSTVDINGANYTISTPTIVDLDVLSAGVQMDGYSFLFTNIDDASLSRSAIVDFADSQTFNQLFLDIADIVGEWFLVFDFVTPNKLLSIPLKVGQTYYNLGAAIGTNSSVLGLNSVTLYGHGYLRTNLIDAFSVNGLTINGGDIHSTVYEKDSGLMISLGKSGSLSFLINITSPFTNDPINGYPFISIGNSDLSGISLSVDALTSCGTNCTSTLVSIPNVTDTVNLLSDLTGSPVSALSVTLTNDNPSNLGLAYIDSISAFTIPQAYINTIDSVTISPYDYLDTVDYSLVVHSESGSNFLVDFANFKVGDSRFMDIQHQITYQGASGDFTYEMTVNGGNPVVFTDTAKYSTIRQSFDYIGTNNTISQAFQLHATNDIDIRVYHIKVYTIDGWDFFGSSGSSVLDPNSVAFIGKQPQYTGLYNHFLKGDYTLEELANAYRLFSSNTVVDNPYAEIPGNTLLYTFDASSAGIVTPDGSSVSTGYLSVSRSSSGEFVIYMPFADVSYGHYLVFRAQAYAPGNEYAYTRLSYIESGGQTIWQSVNGSYEFMQNWDTNVVDLGNSPLPQNSVWGDYHGLTLHFTTTDVAIRTSLLNIDYIQLKSDSSYNLDINRVDAVSNFLSPFDTIGGTFCSLTCSTTLDTKAGVARYTASGSAPLAFAWDHNKIPSWASFVSKTQFDYAKIIVQGTTETTGYTFGYYSGIFFNPSNFIPLGTVSSKPSVFRINDNQAQYFALGTWDGSTLSPVSAGLYVDVLDYSFVKQQYAFPDGPAFIDNWYPVALFDHIKDDGANGAKLTNAPSGYNGETLDPFNELLMRSFLSSDVFSEYNYVSFDYTVHHLNSSVQLGIFDLNANGKYSAVSVIIIPETLSGDASGTFVADLQSYRFNSQTMLGIITNDGLIDSSGTLSDYGYVEFNHLLFSSGNFANGNEGVGNAESHGNDVVVSIDQSANSLSTSKLSVDDPSKYDSLYIDLTVSSSYYIDDLDFYVSVYNKAGKESILDLDPSTSATYLYRQFTHDVRSSIIIPLDDINWLNASYYIVTITMDQQVMPLGNLAQAITLHSFTLLNQLYHFEGTAYVDPGIDTGGYVNSGFASIVTGPVGRNGDGLELRTNGTNGTLSANPAKTPVGEYVLSFFYRTIAANSGELLHVKSPNEDYYYPLTPSDRYIHIREYVNISAPITFDTLYSALFFQIIDNDGYETVVYLDSVMLTYMYTDNLVTTERVLGIQSNPVFDALVVPRSGGMELKVSAVDEQNNPTSTELSILFDPSTMAITATTYIGGTPTTYSITDLWYPYLPYRVNLFGDVSGYHLGIYEASSNRDDAINYVALSYALSSGKKAFSASSIDANLIPSSVDEFTLTNLGKYTGIEAIGFFRRSNGVLYHYDKNSDDTVTLVDTNGQYLKTYDYSFSFHYQLLDGGFSVHSAGADLNVSQSTVVLNGVSCACGASEGDITIEKYGSSVAVYLNGQAVVLGSATSSPDNQVWFSGASEYKLSLVQLEFKSATGAPSEFLTLQGPTFTISPHNQKLDVTTATDMNVYTQAPMQISTDNAQDPTYTSSGLIDVRIQDYYDISTAQRQIYFKHNPDGNSSITLFKGYSVTIEHPSNNYFDNGFDSASAFQISDGDKLSETQVLNNGYSNVVRGSTSEQLKDYLMNFDATSHYLISTRFYLDPTPSSGKNSHSIFRLILASGTDAQGNPVQEYVTFDNYHDVMKIPFQVYHMYMIDTPEGPQQAISNIEDPSRCAWYDTYVQESILTYGNSFTSTSKVNLQAKSTPVDNCNIPIIKDYSMTDYERALHTWGVSMLSDKADWYPNGQPTGDFSGWHDLQVAYMQNKYYIYLDGAVLNVMPSDPMINMQRGTITNAPKIGFSLNEGAYIDYYRVEEGSSILPTGISVTKDDGTGNFQPTNQYIALDGKVLLLPTNDGDVALETTGSFFANSFSTASATVIPYSNHDPRVMMVDTNTGNQVGVDFGNGNLHIVNPVGADQSLGTISDYTRDFWTVSADMNSNWAPGDTGAGFGYVYPAFDVYNDTSIRDPSSSVISTTKMPYNAQIKLRIIADLGEVAVNDVKISTVHFLMDDNGANDQIQAIEGTGVLPTYRLAAPDTFVAKLSNTAGNQEIKKSIVASGQDNSTLQFATDFIVDSTNPVSSGGDATSILEVTKGTDLVGKIAVDHVTHEIYVSYVYNDTGITHTDLIGSYIVGQPVTVSLDYHLDTGLLNASLSTLDIHNTLQVPLLQGLISIGDVLDLSVRESNFGTGEYSYVDNILLPNQDVETFYSANSDDVFYQSYEKMVKDLVLDRDVGARYLSVMVKTFTEYTTINLYIDGQYIDYKVAPYALHSNYVPLVYYIPTTIDTTMMHSITLETNSVIRSGDIGYLKSQAPSQLLYTGTTNDGSNTNLGYLFSDWANTNSGEMYSTPFMSMYSGPVQTHTGETVSNTGGNSMTVDDQNGAAHAFSNGVFNANDLAEFGLYTLNGANAYTAAQGTSIFNEANTYGSSYMVPGMELFTINHDLKDFRLIMKLTITRNIIDDTATPSQGDMTFDLYLIINVGSPTATGIQDQIGYYDANASTPMRQYSCMNIAVAMFSMPACTPNGIVQNNLGFETSNDYGWLEMNYPLEALTVVNLRQAYNQYIAGMDNLNAPFYDGNVASDSSYGNNIWSNHPGGYLINGTQTSDSYGKIWSIWRPDIGLDTQGVSPYKGEITGFDGFAIDYNTQGGVSQFNIYDVYMRNNPVYGMAHPTVGRSSSFFNYQSTWQSAYTTRSGMLDVQSTLGLNGITQERDAVIISNIQVSAETDLFLTVTSNMPYLLFMDDRFVGYSGLAGDLSGTITKYYHINAPSGETTLTALLISPKNVAADWVWGYTAMGDYGADFSVLTPDVPGLTTYNGADYVNQFVTTTELSASATSTIGTQTHNLGFGYEDIIHWHDSIPLPKDQFKLKSDPKMTTKTTIAKAGTSSFDGNGRTPMVTSTDYMADHLDTSTADPYWGTVFASTNLFVGKDYAADSNQYLGLDFSFADWQNVWAVMIDNYIIYRPDDMGTWYISDYTANMVTYQLSELDPVEGHVSWNINGAMLLDYSGTTYDHLVMNYDASPGMHHISIATRTPSATNPTASDIFDTGMLDFGLGVYTYHSDTLTSSQMADDVYTILAPPTYTTNLKETDRTVPNLDNSGGEGSARFAPLTKSNIDGVNTAQSYWMLDKYGHPHLIRETIIGFKSAMGYCAQLDPTSDNAKTGVLYTMITFDPGTPQQQVDMVQRWLDAGVESNFYSTNSQSSVNTASHVPKRPDGSLGLDEYTLFQSAVTTSFSQSLAFTSDSIQFNSIDTTMSFDYNSFTLTMPSSTDMRWLNTPYSHASISSVNDTADLSSYSAALFNGTSLVFQLSSVNQTISRDYSKIIFMFSNGAYAIIDPELMLLTVVDKDITYRYYYSFRSFEMSSETYGVAYFYDKGTSYYLYNIDMYANTISSEKKESMIIKGAYAATSDAIMADMAWANGDPNYQQLQERANSLYNQAQQDAAKRDKNRIFKWGRKIAGVLEAEANIVSGTVNFYVKAYIGGLKALALGGWDSYQNYLADAAKEYAQELCSNLLTIFDTYAQIVVAGLKWLKDKVLDWVMGKVKDLFSTVWDTIKTGYGALEDAASDIGSGVQSWVTRYVPGLEYNVPCGDGTGSECKSLTVPPDYNPDQWLMSTVLSHYKAIIPKQVMDFLLPIANYVDFLNGAKARFNFLALYAMLFGTSIGYRYSLKDLFPGMSLSEYESASNDPTILRAEGLPTKIATNNVLEVSAMLNALGDAPWAVKLRIKIMTGLAAAFGMTIGYDPTPIGDPHVPDDGCANKCDYYATPSGSQAVQVQDYNATMDASGLPGGVSVTSSTVQNPQGDLYYSFTNFDWIARPDKMNHNWHYFMMLGPDLNIPFTLATIPGFGGGLQSILKNTLGNALTSALTGGAIETMNKAVSMQQQAAAGETGVDKFLSSGEGWLMQAVTDVVNVMLNIDFGVVFAFGKKTFGFQGLDVLKSMLNFNGYGTSNYASALDSTDNIYDPGAKQTDVAGRPTKQDKWKFKVGLSEENFIMLVELLLNFIPGWGDLIGLYQDVRDTLFADQFIDRTVAFFMILPDLGSIGATQKATESVKDGTKTTIKETGEDELKIFKGENGASIEALKKGHLGFFFGPLFSFSEKVNKFGGGGAKGFLKTTLWPVVAVKKFVFGATGLSLAKDVISGKVADKVLRASESLGAKGIDHLADVPMDLISQTDAWKSLSKVDQFFTKRALNKANEVIRAEQMRVAKNLRRGADDEAARLGQEAYDKVIASGGTEDLAKAASDTASSGFKSTVQNVGYDLDKLNTQFEEATKKYALLMMEEGKKAADKLGMSDKAFAHLDDMGSLMESIQRDGMKADLENFGTILKSASDKASEEIFGKAFPGSTWLKRTVTNVAESSAFLPMLFAKMIKLLFTAPIKFVKFFGQFLKLLATGISGFFKKLFGAANPALAKDQGLVNDMYKVAEDGSEIDPDTMLKDALAFSEEQARQAEITANTIKDQTDRALNELEVCIQSVGAVALNELPTLDATLAKSDCLNMYKAKYNIPDDKFSKIQSSEDVRFWVQEYYKKLVDGKDFTRSRFENMQLVRDFVGQDIVTKIYHKDMSELTDEQLLELTKGLSIEDPWTYVRITDFTSDCRMVVAEDPDHPAAMQTLISNKLVDEEVIDGETVYVLKKLSNDKPNLNNYYVQSLGELTEYLKDFALRHGDADPVWDAATGVYAVDSKSRTASVIQGLDDEFNKFRQRVEDFPNEDPNLAKMADQNGIALYAELTHAISQLEVKKQQLAAAFDDPKTPFDTSAIEASLGVSRAEIKQAYLDAADRAMVVSASGSGPDFFWAMPKMVDMKWSTITDPVTGLPFQRLDPVFDSGAIPRNQWDYNIGDAKAMFEPTTSGKDRVVDGSKVVMQGDDLLVKFRSEPPFINVVAKRLGLDIDQTASLMKVIREDAFQASFTEYTRLNDGEFFSKVLDSGRKKFREFFDLGDPLSDTDIPMLQVWDSARGSPFTITFEKDGVVQSYMIPWMIMDRMMDKARGVPFASNLPLDRLGVNNEFLYNDLRGAFPDMTYDDIYQGIKDGTIKLDPPEINSLLFDAVNNNVINAGLADLTFESYVPVVYNFHPAPPGLSLEMPGVTISDKVSTEYREYNLDVPGSATATETTGVARLEFVVVRGIGLMDDTDKKLLNDYYGENAWVYIDMSKDNAPKSRVMDAFVRQRMITACGSSSAKCSQFLIPAVMPDGTPVNIKYQTLKTDGSTYSTLRGQSWRDGERVVFGIDDSVTSHYYVGLSYYGSTTVNDDGKLVRTTGNTPMDHSDNPDLVRLNNPSVKMSFAYDPHNAESFSPKRSLTKTDFKQFVRELAYKNKDRSLMDFFFTEAEDGSLRDNMVNIAYYIGANPYDATNKGVVRISRYQLFEYFLYGNTGFIPKDSTIPQEVLDLLPKTLGYQRSLSEKGVKNRLGTRNDFINYIMDSAADNEVYRPPNGSSIRKRLVGLFYRLKSGNPGFTKFDPHVQQMLQDNPNFYKTLTQNMEFEKVGNINRPIGHQFTPVIGSRGGWYTPTKGNDFTPWDPVSNVLRQGGSDLKLSLTQYLENTYLKAIEGYFSDTSTFKSPTPLNSVTIDTAPNQEQYYKFDWSNIYDYIDGNMYSPQEILSNHELQVFAYQQVADAMANAWELHLQEYIATRSSPETIEIDNSTEPVYHISSDPSYQYTASIIGSSDIYISAYDPELLYIYNYSSLAYDEVSLIKNGEWNPDIFVSSDATSVPDGMLPRPHFNDPNDPLSVLSACMYYFQIEADTQTRHDLDAISDNWYSSYIVNQMGSIDLYNLLRLYDDLQLQQISQDLGMEFYNDVTKQSYDLYSLMDSVKRLETAELLQTANPFMGNDGISAMFNQYYLDTLREKVYNPSFNPSSLSRFDSNMLGRYTGFESGLSMFDLYDLPAWAYADPSFSSAFATDSSIVDENTPLNYQMLHYLSDTGTVQTLPKAGRFSEIQNLLDIISQVYDSMGFTSNNAGFFSAIASEFSLNWDLQNLVTWGVRNKGAQLPPATKEVFILLKDYSNYNHRNLIRYLLDQIMA